MVLESDFTPQGGGGAESQVRTLALHLMRIGQRVAVVTPLLARGRQITAERCEGIPVGRIRYPRLPTVGAAVMCLRFAAFLLGHGRRYDAWHVHIAHHLGAVTCLVGALVGKPVVVKISGSWELEQGVWPPGDGSCSIGVALSWLKRASVVQAISTPHRRRADPARISRPADRGAAERRRHLAVLAHGPLPRAGCAVHRSVRGPAGSREESGDAARRLGAGVPGRRTRSTPDCGWLAAGRSRSELRAQVKRLGLARQVEFLGHRDRVEEVLADADVGVLPSRIEGLSNTLLEFMASGLPTLASRVSGSEDFVVHRAQRLAVRRLGRRPP